MSHAMGLSDSQADLLFGTFSSLLFLTPVIGGYIADRFIGFRRAIIIGAILMIVGYAVMALRNPEAFLWGMSIVIVGNGLFKPNVSGIVGCLYDINDPRRDGGFTLFYMGINIGALIPPLFAGPLVNHFGWHWGFLIASIGLAIGLAIFLGFKSWLGNTGEVPTTSPLRKKDANRVAFTTFYCLGIIALVVILRQLFQFPDRTDLLLIAVSAGILCAILLCMFNEQPEQRRKLAACLILITISVGFWAVYVQTFTSLMLFADRNMSKSFLGITIDAEFTQFFNPFFIIVLSLFLSRFWIWLDQRGKDPSTPVKFTYGLLMMGLGFLVLGLGVRWLSVDGMSSPWILVGSYFLQTIGELLISPIGLAMITRLAPHHLVGMMMGVWFLVQSAAFAIGGGLATWASIPSGTSVEQSSLIYSNAFLKFAAISLLLTFISYLLVPYVRRLIMRPK
jgi:POT family proton-dependent oligopeptide transporter